MSRAVAVLAVASLLAFCPTGARAAAIDADGFAAGTDISKAFVSLGVTLSATGNYSGKDGKVYARANARASTDSMSFGSSWTVTPSQWNRGAATAPAFRADFTTPQPWVSIDAIGSDLSDYAWLAAYDSSNHLLGSYYTPVLHTGTVNTMSLSRPQGDIAWITAAGINGDVVYLDNLQFGAIPEPSVTLLALTAAAFLAKRKWRRARG